MLLLRAYDEQAVALQRQGRIGAYPPFWGDEGIQAAAVLGVRDTDWLFPTHRENAIAILRGLAPERALAYFTGDPDALVDPWECACAPLCAQAAAHVPHSVGWAWGQAMAGSDRIAVAFVGDGATSDGDFHEGVTLAGMLQAPVVLLCTSNRWAVSMCVEQRTAAKAIIDKAVGYGIAGVQVDGFDASALRSVVAAAADRARAGRGPTLVEAMCYRIGPDAVAEDPPRDPVARLRDRLLECGELTVADFDRELDDAKAAMAAAAAQLANAASERP